MEGKVVWDYPEKCGLHFVAFLYDIPLNATA